MSLQYHLEELEIARDPTNPKRTFPPITSAHKRILDVGCGMGQTLISAQLGPDVRAYGIDRDIDAVQAGRRIAAPNIQLLMASGEHLPFAGNSFDLVFSRVALPYMHIETALAEIVRVLRPGGDVWLALHPVQMSLRRLKTAILRLQPKDVVFSSYVLLNGFIFNSAGQQFSFVGRTETFQTTGGIKRSLRKAGLTKVSVSRNLHFTVQAQKPV